MKSQDCIDAIDIWETIRHWFFEQESEGKRTEWYVDYRPPLNEGQYPLPKIEKVGGE